MLDVHLATLLGQLLPACRDDPWGWQPPWLVRIVARAWVASVSQLALIAKKRPIVARDWGQRPRTEGA